MYSLLLRKNSKIEQKGVYCCFVTLHVGLATFRPVREENPLLHPIYEEYGVVPQTVATDIAQAKKEGRRVICIGTTAVRLIEHAARNSKSAIIEPFTGEVNLFILPGHKFRIMNALITNFHLPKSTLMMLVTAFGGRDFINQAYQEAIEQRYRFYSFGDAMLII